MTRTFGKDFAIRSVSSSLKLSMTMTSRAQASARSVRSMFAASSRVVMTGVTLSAKPLILLFHRSGDALPRELLHDESARVLACSLSCLGVADECADRLRQLARLRAADDARAAARNVARQSDAARHH